MLTCLIVDDEPMAVQLLADYVQQVPFLKLLYQSHHALDVLALLRQQPVDIAFLDINLPRITGLELADLLPLQTRVIFTTAYAEYAVQSYEKNAVDYLLKPITFERFLKAINRVSGTPETVLHGLAAQPMIQTPTSHADASVLFVKSGRSWVRLVYDELRYVEGLKDYVQLHSETGPLIVYKRLRELEQTLPTSFVRIHHSYIVNLTYVQRIEDNHVHLPTPERGVVKLPISDTYRPTFMERLSRLVR